MGSDDKYKAICMAAPVPMVVTRMSDQKIVDINPCFTETTGFSRDEVLGLDSSELGTWSNLEDRAAFWSLLEQDKTVRNFEFAVRTKSGELKVCLLSGAITLIAGEEFAVSLFRDITERKNTEESLDKRVHFEQLLVDLSSRFINLPSHQVDHEIESGLMEIRQFLGVDRAALLEISPDRQEVRVAYANLHESLQLPYPIGTNVVPFYPWVHDQVVLQGKTLRANSLEDFPLEGEVDRESFRQAGIEAVIDIPLAIGGVSSHLVHISFRHPYAWPEEYIPRMRVLGEVFVNALARKTADEKRRQDFQEIKELKERLQLEANYLRSEIELTQGPGEIIGQSQAIQQVLRQVEQVGPADSHVLIMGETGTGKELVARAIHNKSHRKERLMVTVNCATLSPTLIECELFGREKGAYTGALTRQIGRFELADGGTIFLDEIGELPIDLQSKLLRVLQEGELERLGGSTKTIRVNVRVIAATNKNLVESVRKGDFRKDLYYRLSVFPIEVPPLRERVEDIPLLTWAFIDEFGIRMGKKIDAIPQKIMNLLLHYSWPGNVRELRNTIERAMILCQGGRLEIQIPKNLEEVDSSSLTLEEMESKYIRETLQKTGGRIKGPGGAAELLGLKPTTLYSKMKKLGVKQMHS